MGNVDISVLVEALKSPPEEYWYWWSQITLTAIAFISALIGLWQLRGIRQSREDAVHIARATFLLEIDRRWESEDMTAARGLVRLLLAEAHKAVAAEFPDRNDAGREQEAAKKIAEQVGAYQKAGAPEYRSVLVFCGFFETAGIMVKNKHIPLEDILDLFGGPLEHLNSCFRPHIVERQNQTGVPKGLFEHALYLCDRLPRRGS